MKFFDIPIFYLINQGCSNSLFNLLMPAVSRIGGGELYFMLGILLTFFRKKEIKALGLLIIAGLTVSYYTVGFLKVLVARTRPFAALPGAILLAVTEKNYSFPSGHAVNAFMAASLLSNRFKKYVLFYSLAALMAFSRIYIGVHYPSDVMCGALIGIAIGYFLIYISKTFINNKQ